MTNVTLPFGLQGGSVYQRSVKQEKTATLTGVIIAGSGGINDLHSAQANLAKLLGADVSRPQAPTRIIYDSGYATGVELNADVLYEGGLEFNSLDGLTLTSVPLRFLQPDGTMEESNPQAQTIGTSYMGVPGSIMYLAANGRDASTPGSWNAIANSMFNSSITGISAGGWVITTGGYLALWMSCHIVSSGATVGGVATGGIIVLSGLGTTWPTIQVTAEGAGTGLVNAIAQAGAASDWVYIGGSFTSYTDSLGTVHSFPYLVLHQLSTGNVTAPISLSGAVQGMAYCPVTYGQGVGGMTDVLYVVGNNFNSTYPGIFEIDNPGQASPTMSPVPWGQVNSSSVFVPGVLPYACTNVGSIAVDPNGTVYIVASNGTYAVILMGVPGAATPPLTPGATNWVQIGNITQSGFSTAGQLKVGPDGTLYIVNLSASGCSISPGGAALPGVAKWTGGGWISISPNTGNYNRIDISPDNKLFMAGATNAPTSRLKLLPGGSLNSVNGALSEWDGSSVHVELLDSDGSNNQVFINPNDGSVVVTLGAAQPVVYATPQLITYTGTAPTPIKIVLQSYATSTTSPTMVGGIRNERTGQAIYFIGLAMAENEVIVIDTTPGNSFISSDLRGDLSSFVAPSSNLSDFVLLEGENYLSVLTSTPSYLEAYITYFNRHYGIDGAGTNINRASYEAL
jgi:hypothetical protein